MSTTIWKTLFMVVCRHPLALLRYSCALIKWIFSYSRGSIRPKVTCGRSEWRCGKCCTTPGSDRSTTSLTRRSCRTWTCCSRTLSLSTSWLDPPSQTLPRMSQTSWTSAGEDRPKSDPPSGRSICSLSARH